MIEPAFFSITEAKVHLEEVLAAAEAGHEVILTRWGKPVVRVVPLESGTLHRLDDRTTGKQARG